MYIISSVQESKQEFVYKEIGATLVLLFIQPTKIILLTSNPPKNRINKASGNAGLFYFILPPPPYELRNVKFSKSVAELQN